MSANAHDARPYPAMGANLTTFEEEIDAPLRP
jgi:hypothetical protein